MQPQREVSTREPPERARILAAHDRPEVLRLVEHALGDEYECEFATSVAAAREKLTASFFQLAMCDIQMPRGAGLVLVQELARNHPETAIVLITGIDNPAVAEDAFRLGAHGYLVKPFWPSQLRITTANALRQHRLELAERARHRALLGSPVEKAEALRNELIEAQRRTIANLCASRLETVERLASAIEMHDVDSAAHIDRMASIAAMLAGELGLDSRRVEMLRTAATLHDVGNVATPDAVLRKAGRLTPRERERMESHTVVGHRILAGSTNELLEMAATIALTHHEWFDGSGYPQGLSREKIPVEGRIVATADVFDALLSERPYRPALEVDEATTLLAAEREAHFDPDAVDALLENLDRAVALRG